MKGWQTMWRTPGSWFQGTGCNRPGVQGPAAAAAPAAAHSNHCRGPKRASVACGAATRCHYDVLGIAPTASADEIKSAWRSAARRLHPDRNSDPDAPHAFKAARDAYEVLSDPQQRAAYNKARTARSRSSSSFSYSSSSGGTSGGSARTRRQYSHVDYAVIYDYVDDEELNEADFAADVPGSLFYGWYATSGSWQSSWQANAKKRKAKEQQQQQQQQQQAGTKARVHTQQADVTLDEILQRLDSQTLAVVHHVFGSQLQHLGSLEELADLIAAMELLRAEGIQPDPNMFRTRSRSSSRGRTGKWGYPDAGRQQYSSRTSASSSTSSTRSTSRSSRSSSSSSSSSSSASQRRATGKAAAATQDAQRSSSSSSSSGRQRTDTTSSRGRVSSHRNNNSSNSSSSSSSSSRRSSRSSSSSGKLPRFDELSYVELYEVMTDWANPQQAHAARAWASNYAAEDPAAAAEWGGMFAIDYLTADFDGGLDDESDDLDGDEDVVASFFASRDPDPLRGSSFNPWNEHPERNKHRSKPGSGGDYVKYPDESDDDDESSDDAWVL